MGLKVWGQIHCCLHCLTSWEDRSPGSHGGCQLLKLWQQQRGPQIFSSDPILCRVNSEHPSHSAYCNMDFRLTQTSTNAGVNWIYTEQQHTLLEPERYANL